MPAFAPRDASRAPPPSSDARRGRRLHAGAAPFHGDRREPDLCRLSQYVCGVSFEEPPENPVPVVLLLAPAPAEPCGPSPS
jgi:hypothetical protein